MWSETSHQRRALALLLIALLMGLIAAPASQSRALAEEPRDYDQEWVDGVIGDLIRGMAVTQGRYDLIFGDGGPVLEPPKVSELRACLESGIRSGGGPVRVDRIRLLGSCMARVDPLGQLSDPPTGRPVDLSWAPELVDSLTVWMVSTVLPAMFEEYPESDHEHLITAVINTIDSGQVQRCVTAYGLLGASRSKIEEQCMGMLILEALREAAAVARLLRPSPPPADAPPPPPSPVPATPTRTPTRTPTQVPPQVCNLTGRWSGSTTNWGGRWDLTQQGTSVTGTFPGSSPSYAGEVRGTITGNRFVGTWRWTGVQSRSGEGDFDYTISDDCRRLTGRMRIGGSGAWFNDSLQRQ